MARNYDSNCLDLAELFLGSEPKLRPRARELAEHIREEIEMWIAQERRQTLEVPSP